MRKTFIYDLPTRLFHWLFSGLILLSFVIAKTVDDESVVFSYHMLSGLLLGSLILWRIYWGVFGTRHARFNDFSLKLVDLKNYFLGTLTGSKKRWPGHNPASSWAAIVMFLLSLGLAVTGYLMTTGNKETFEDIHELMANSLIIVAILHVVGVILHSILHRDAIGLSMLDGKKELFESHDSISSAKRFAAIVLVALFCLVGLSLYKNFDSENRRLTLFGQSLQLGDSKIPSAEE